MTEDEMAGWHRRLGGHEFEQTSRDGESQRILACCSPWGQKESDTSEQLNNRNAEPWSLSQTECLRICLLTRVCASDEH